MEPSDITPSFSQKSQDHQEDEQPESPLGRDQMEPVQGGRDRMKSDAALDPLIFHDGSARNIACEPEKGGKNVSPPDSDKV